MIEEGLIYDVIFSDLDFDGQGVCKLEESYPVFVKGALKGEKGKIKLTKRNSKYGFGTLLEIKVKSPFRVNPICPYYELCGGCNLMHLDYHKQLEYKKYLVKNTLNRIGKIDTLVNDCLGMEESYYYRNKVEVPYGYDGKIIAGFYMNKTHQLVNQDRCYIAPKINEEITVFFKSLFKVQGIPIYKGIDNTIGIKHVITRVSNYNGDIMIIIVTNNPLLPKKDILVANIIKKFPSVKSIIHNINPGNTSLIMGYESKTIYGNYYILDNILGNFLEISAHSFFQVNSKMTVKLYQKILEYASLSNNEVVIDAYCGIGSISLCLARKAKMVYGIEIVPQAILNANKNKEINNISNVQFILGSCEEKIKELSNIEKIDLIVFDPPRKGCEKSFLDSVIKMNIKRIIYVSCNVRTLARDLNYLSLHGYSVQEATPVDMFPHTTHVETVTLLSRKDIDDVIKVKLDMDKIPPLDEELKATYSEIREYVLKNHNVKVSSLEIAQVKEKNGIKERENYNKPKSVDTRQPFVTKEKIVMIEEALKHFKMI